jgi:hypothetical protein
MHTQLGSVCVYPLPLPPPGCEHNQAGTEIASLLSSPSLFRMPAQLGKVSMCSLPPPFACQHLSAGPAHAPAPLLLPSPPPPPCMPGHLNQASMLLPFMLAYLNPARSHMMRSIWQPSFLCRRMVGRMRRQGQAPTEERKEMAEVVRVLQAAAVTLVMPPK